MPASALRPRAGGLCVRNGLVSESVLRAYPSSVKYSRNRAAVERAFALADRRAENGGESEARGMLHDAGCPS